MNENWERVLKIEWKFIVKEREKGDEKRRKKNEGKREELIYNIEAKAITGIKIGDILKGISNVFLVKRLKRK